MHIVEASAQGTIRVIAVLVVLWLLLRYLRGRSKQRNFGPAPHEPHRPKGDVRIERPSDPTRGGPPSGGRIEDADYEEVK